MFKQKASATKIKKTIGNEFDLEQWQQEPLNGNMIHRLTLPILNPEQKYLLVNTCQDLYVGIKGSLLILQALQTNNSNGPLMVKDSSITALIAAGVLTVNLFDMQELVLIWVAINPDALVAIQSEGEVNLQEVDI